MSSILINSLLILDGNLTCNGDITITPSGQVIPIPDSDLKKSFYSYHTNAFTTSNGQGRTITSTTGNITVQGLIDGKGQGFNSDRGPGTNSNYLDSSGNKFNGYGASHAGLGAISTTFEVPAPAKTYGNHETPVSLGSGSGYYHSPSDFFGQETSGGGAVKLLARSGNITVDGDIVMDGQDGTNAGGASGGSIWLQGWNINGSGALSAQGGTTLLSNDAGGGGGGYISLWYDRTNSFSGDLLVLGKAGAGPGKLFTKKVEPILEENFTGDIWNTKWWDNTSGSVTLNNKVTLTSPLNDYSFPAVGSLFTVSGKNITAAIDYIPVGSETPQYNINFLMQADANNWFGIARKPTGLYGVSMVDGVQTSSGVPFDYTNVTFRVMKTDSTFLFQYYDATSTPQTIYTDVRPELAEQTFKIFMNLNKFNSLNHAYQFRVSPLDISRQYVEVDGTFVDATAIALNVIGGPSLYYGSDFSSVVGNKITWDSTLGSLLDSNDVLRAIYPSNPSPNLIAGTFDSLRIYDGVIKGIETVEPIIYVDPDYGSDSSAGLQLSPLQNLFVATAWSKKGGTVVLYDGTYNPTYVARKDITIRGAEGVKPLITSKNVQDTTGSGWENNALSFYGCQGRVENVQIADATVGIKIENTDLFEISRNLLHDVSSAVKIINCDPLIIRNVIHDASIAVDFSSCWNPVINSNLIYDSSVGFRASSVVGFELVGNTIDNCKTAVLVDRSSSGIVSSNSLTDCTMGFSLSTDSSAGSFYNNYGNTVTAYSRTPDGLAGDQSVDPLYIGSGDYHLTNVSPNIGAGQVTYDDYKIDLDGASRADGTLNAAIGAYEFIDGTHVGDYYVAGNGNDVRNFGGLNDPFRTLDKAMLMADSTIRLDGGHSDSYFLKLKSESVIFESPFAIGVTPLNHYMLYYTVMPSDISKGSMKIPAIVPIEDFSNVALNVIGGPTQNYGTDFVIDTSNWFDSSAYYLSWSGLGLAPLISAGDILRVQFNGGLQHRFQNFVIHNHYSNIEKERTVFVSTGGSDSTDMGGDGTNTGGNGTLLRPYRTITKALSNSSAGDYIIAIAGEYPLFNGLDDRILVAGIDRTGIPDRTSRIYFEDLFMPADFRVYGTTEYDNVQWDFTSAGNSSVNSGGGFLNFTYDGTNSAIANSSFQIVNDYEVFATLRCVVDPIKFSITSPDNTAYFNYDSSTFSTGVYTGGSNYWVDGTVASNMQPQKKYITAYIPISANDIRNKWATLTYIPEPDTSNTTLSVVGGTTQNYGTDYYIEDSKVKWDGMSLDGELEPGDLLRVIYLDSRLSDPVRVHIALKGNKFVIRYYDTTWHTVMRKTMVGTYHGPWDIAFKMDTANPVNHYSIFGKGFVSQFLAIGESFVDLNNGQVFKQKTDRRSLTLYEDLGLDFNYDFI